MQLDLFEDNRPGILLNLADEFIRSRDLDQAVSVYEQLVEEYPGDRHSAAMLETVSQWHNSLAGLNLPETDNFRNIWLRFDSITHPPLRSTVLTALIDQMSALPDPERIYAPPRFHFGHILMEAGRYTEAANRFYAALAHENIPRGRFMAWRGDALTLAKKDSDAMRCYLEAFLDDPLTVDTQSIKNHTIHNLHNSLHFELTDETDEEDESSWLPVWGWLQGVFMIPLQAAPGTETADAKGFEALLKEDKYPLPRIWFAMLTHAERQRAITQDARELAAVRRLMKNTNSFMFDCYLDKISGRR